MKFLMSSADPKKISLSVRSFLLAILPLIMAVTGLTESELSPIIDALVEIVFLGTALLSAIGMVYGIARKIYLRRWSAAE